MIMIENTTLDLDITIVKFVESDSCIFIYNSSPLYSSAFKVFEEEHDHQCWPFFQVIY